MRKLTRIASHNLLFEGYTNISNINVCLWTDNIKIHRFPVPIPALLIVHECSGIFYGLAHLFARFDRFASKNKCFCFVFGTANELDRNMFSHRHNVLGRSFGRSVERVHPFVDPEQQQKPAFYLSSTTNTKKRATLFFDSLCC